MKLAKVSWISSRNVAKLEQIGIRTTADLMDAGCNASNRAVIAEKIGVTRRKVLGWVRSADLSRVSGIGNDYVVVLTRSNVYTPNDLAKQKVEPLLQKMSDANSTFRLVNRMPAAKSISRWINSAQSLPTVVSYEA